MIRSTGRTITSNTTSADTGFAGSRNVGTRSGPEQAEALRRPGLHGHPGQVEVAELGQRLDHQFGAVPAGRAGDQHHLGHQQPGLDQLAEPPRIAGRDADPVGLGAGVPGGGGQRERVDVVHLAGPGRAGHVDQFVADRDDRQPGPRVHQHLVPADGGEQPDLRGADEGAEPHRDVTGLHVLAGPADVLARFDRLDHRHPGAAALGVRARDDGVGDGRQRGAGRDVHRLRAAAAGAAARAPASISPTTGSTTGWPSAAMATSTERTA